MYQLVKPELECVESEANYGRYVAEPLEKGFGITLGNALRRVILGSLPGAAVTEVKIEGVQHEFAAIPYLREDGIDFMLNVKNLRLRAVSGREGKLLLEANGAKEVRAGDISPSADFDVINPDLHLATLTSEDAKLRVEFTIGLGKGYEPASHDGLAIGAIPVDAIYTPVRKINYQVEPTRAGQQGGYERLVLDIWTDGSISPNDALAGGVQILVEQLSRLTIKVEGAAELAPVSPELRDLAIDQVGFTQSIVRRLKRNRVNSLGELLTKTREELLSLENFGPKSLEEVEKALAEKGLSLSWKE